MAKIINVQVAIPKDLHRMAKLELVKRDMSWQTFLKTQIEKELLGGGPVHNSKRKEKRAI